MASDRVEDGDQRPQRLPGLEIAAGSRDWMEIAAGFRVASDRVEDGDQ